MSQPDSQPVSLLEYVGAGLGMWLGWISVYHSVFAGHVKILALSLLIFGLTGMALVSKLTDVVRRVRVTNKRRRMWRKAAKSVKKSEPLPLSYHG